MRERVAELKAQYLLALGDREMQLRLQDEPMSALQRFLQAARAKESLLEENTALRKLLDERVAVAYRSSQLMLELGDEVSGDWLAVPGLV